MLEIKKTASVWFYAWNPLKSGQRFAPSPSVSLRWFRIEETLWKLDKNGVLISYIVDLRMEMDLQWYWIEFLQKFGKIGANQVLINNWVSCCSQDGLLAVHIFPRVFLPNFTGWRVPLPALPKALPASSAACWAGQELDGLGCLYFPQTPHTQIRVLCTHNSYPPFNSPDHRSPNRASTPDLSSSHSVK